MDCEKFDRVVLDLLYQELDSLTASAAARHMEHCIRCRKITAGLRATRTVGTPPIVPLPAGMEEQVLAMERETANHLPISRRLERSVSVIAGYAMRPQLAMGALLLLLIGSSLLLLRAQPGNRERVVIEHSAEGATAPESVAVVARSDASPAIRELDQETTNLEDAWAAYHANRYTEAHQRAEPIAQAGGKHSPEASLLLAQVLRKQSGCRAALSHFEVLRQHYSGADAGLEATWQVGECYRSLGAHDLARRAYESLVNHPGFRERAQTALTTLTPDAKSPTRTKQSQGQKPITR